MSGAFRDEASGLARLAGLLADPTRAAICTALLDGQDWTAGALAEAAEVSRPTASEHLDQLVGAGLLTERRVGRNRYVRLASPQVAAVVEQLSSWAAPPAPGTGPSSYRAVTERQRFTAARTCYDHLAGVLGVAVFDAMVERGLVDLSGGTAVTADGLQWLRGVGVDVEALRARRRTLARVCLDVTERRSHLSGAAGAALCTAVLDAGWVRRRPGGRALTVTEAGRTGFRDSLGVTLPAP